MLTRAVYDFEPNELCEECGDTLGLAIAGLALLAKDAVLLGVHKWLS